LALGAFDVYLLPSSGSLTVALSRPRWVTITTDGSGPVTSPPSVPDTGSSLALAGLGFVTLLALRRRLA
jgi:hypothetical protein